MLKPIPVEEGSKIKTEKQKQPTMVSFHIARVSGENHEDHFLKTMCVHFADFVNKGAQYTVQQIDELTMGLQRTVLRLQKKKRQMIQKKQDQSHNEKPVRFKKKRIS